LLVNNLTATGSNQIEIKRKYILINTYLIFVRGQNSRLFNNLNNSFHGVYNQPLMVLNI